MVDSDSDSDSWVVATTPGVSDSDSDSALLLYTYSRVNTRLCLAGLTATPGERETSPVVSGTGRGMLDFRVAG